MERYHYETQQSAKVVNFRVYDRLNGSTNSHYEERDRHIAHCHSRADAERIVAALNTAVAPRSPSVFE